MDDHGGRYSELAWPGLFTGSPSMELPASQGLASQSRENVPPWHSRRGRHPRLPGIHVPAPTSSSADTTRFGKSVLPSPLTLVPELKRRLKRAVQIIQGKLLSVHILQVDICMYKYMYPRYSSHHCVAHVAILLLGICNECKWALNCVVGIEPVNLSSGAYLAGCT